MTVNGLKGTLKWYLCEVLKMGCPSLKFVSLVRCGKRTHPLGLMLVGLNKKPYQLEPLCLARPKTVDTLSVYKSYC